jgi:hypothetical protein
MKIQYIVVPKDFEIRRDGQIETRTKWNRVGQSWKSSSGVTTFELYMFPGQTFVMERADERPTPETEIQQNQEAQ